MESRNLIKNHSFSKASNKQFDFSLFYFITVYNNAAKVIKKKFPKNIRVLSFCVKINGLASQSAKDYYYKEKKNKINKVFVS